LSTIGGGGDFDSIKLPDFAKSSSELRKPFEKEVFAAECVEGKKKRRRMRRGEGGGGLFLKSTRKPLPATHTHAGHKAPLIE